MLQDRAQPLSSHQKQPGKACMTFTKTSWIHGLGGASFTRHQISREWTGVHAACLTLCAVERARAFAVESWIRKHRPRLHRRVGRILIAVSASMTAGYVLIHVRGLHFHTNDFSTLKQGEGLSVLAPWFWPFLGRCMHTCTFGMTGSKDPAAFAFVTFETCAAVYWLVTAGWPGTTLGMEGETQRLRRRYA